MPQQQQHWVPALLSPAATSCHGLLHSDRHGDQGGAGFVTVLVSKSLTGETNVKPAEEALHVLFSGMHLQTTRAELRRNMVASKELGAEEELQH